MLMSELELRVQKVEVDLVSLVGLEDQQVEGG